MTICIGAMGHFKTLHAAACDPGGPAAALKWARGGFKQKEAMQRQATQWGARSLERALALLVETDLTLRSASRAPTMGVVERALIRLAMMKREAALGPKSGPSRGGLGPSPVPPLEPGIVPKRREVI